MCLPQHRQPQFRCPIKKRRLTYLDFDHEDGDNHHINDENGDDINNINDKQATIEDSLGGELSFAVQPGDVVLGCSHLPSSHHQQTMTI